MLIAEGDTGDVSEINRFDSRCDGAEPGYQVCGIELRHSTFRNCAECDRPAHPNEPDSVDLDARHRVTVSSCVRTRNALDTKTDSWLIESSQGSVSNGTLSE